MVAYSFGGHPVYNLLSNLSATEFAILFPSSVCGDTSRGACRLNYSVFGWRIRRARGLIKRRPSLRSQIAVHAASVWSVGRCAGSKLLCPSSVRRRRVSGAAMFACSVKLQPHLGVLLLTRCQLGVVAATCGWLMARQVISGSRASCTTPAVVVAGTRRPPRMPTCVVVARF